MWKLLDHNEYGILQGFIKKGILRMATRGKKWALQVTSSSNFRLITYQQLLREMHNALQQIKFHEMSNDESEDITLRSSRLIKLTFYAVR